MKKILSAQWAGELISEAVAVGLIIAFGDSAACMYLLYHPSPYLHSYWGLCMVWGLAVAMAIYVTGSVSGTHANPAVTLALAAYRGFAWKKSRSLLPGPGGGGNRRRGRGLSFILAGDSCL